MIIFAIIAAIVIILASTILLASCKAAGDFDEAMDAWIEQREEDKNGN